MTGRAERAIEVQGRPESWDPKARTLDVCLSTGATVLREDWWSGKKYRETLGMEPGNIRLGRLNNGAPFLLQHASHSPNAQLGTFIDGSARIESGQLWATVRFTDEDLAVARQVEPIIQEIVRGIRRKHSVGYDIHSWRETGVGDDGVADVMIDDWEPYEGSCVVLAADDGAHYRGHPAASDPAGMKPAQQQTREAPMATETAPTPTAPATEPAPVIDLDAVRATAKAEGAREAAATIKARDAGIKVTLRATRLDPKTPAVAAIIDGDMPLDAARNALLSLAADADDAPRISGGHRAQEGANHDVDSTIEGMAGLIMARRFGTKIDDNAGRFRRMTVFDMGVHLTELRGGKSDGDRFDTARRMLMGRDATGALGTSHFPLLIAAVARASLSRGYTARRQLYKLFTGIRRAPDLNVQSELHLDSATDLAAVNEFGDYQFANMTEGKEIWQIARRGRIIKLTPELMLNESKALDALAAAPQMLGDAAARTREKLFFTALTANGAMVDTVAMFHANHGNLIDVGSGAAPSWGQIAAMRAKAWQQTDRSGELIEVELDRFLFPSALEATVATLWAPVNAVQVSEAIPDELKNSQHHISPRLDADSTTAYYGFADPSISPAFVAGELEGRAGPQISDEFDFDSGCLKVLVEDYFGIGRTEYRTVVKNAGA